MSHIVLGLGAAALTAAGSVWYLPAAADLRAGDDRPRSTRAAARACLAWWATCGALALVLPATSGWAAPGAVAAAGATTAAALRLRAGLLHRAEQREEAGRWAALGGPVPIADRARTRARARRTFLVWLLSGLAAACATAGALLATAGTGGTLPATAAAAVALLSLVVAAARSHTLR
ncbi:hypothetical protein [Peterkaempfera bronchialis]|uniref:Uncharacterized protein n=1 Tax=Peterkaempfera bronchialis TaxID=2126346 RepID=A0A345SUB0_9ACTN|nr:hypothetical protein [Peterkaempfera bronchialis]AXI77315.1 hypothetical protein C7M71_007525 [Peterkaempfera bronchialis]